MSSSRFKTLSKRNWYLFPTTLEVNHTPLEVCTRARYPIFIVAVPRQSYIFLKFAAKGVGMKTCTLVEIELGRTNRYHKSQEREKMR